jgi:hypothetical protein
MATTLNTLGIVPATPANMKIVTDCRATKGAILEGLSWLVGGAKKGDLLVFYYSGHGSQMVDTSGDEIDKRDETICPHDFAKAGMIKDDDLRAIISKLPAGVSLEVLLDSCHSGTGTREMAALECAPEVGKMAIRYVEPPIDDGFFIEANPALPVRGLLKASRGEKEIVLVPGLNHVLWGGCRDNQTSGEGSVGGVTRGFFTYCFCKSLRSAGAGVTRANLDKMVASCLKGVGAAQIHQLEGTREAMGKKVFT